MNLRRVRNLAILGALFLVVIWGVWYRLHQLVLTVTLLFGATLASARLWKGVEAPLPGARPGPDKAAAPWRDLLAALALLWLGRQIFQAAMDAQYVTLVVELVVMAQLWRWVLPAPLPEKPGPAWALALLGLVVLAGIFRGYRFGDIPAGFASCDEAGTWCLAREFISNIRDTFRVYTGDLGADGTIPFYLMALSLKGFGETLAGFRMESFLFGTLTAGVMYRLGKDLGGRWVGLAAGFLWAVSLWPVTLSRANLFYADSEFMAIVCVALFFAAVRRGDAWRYALAGLFLAFNLNVYAAMRIMMGVLPVFLGLAWQFRPDARRGLGRGVAPLAAGFFIGLSPLLVWLAVEYPSSMNAYFSAFGGSGNLGGNLGSGGLLSRIDTAFTRLSSQFPRNFELFTHRGPVLWWFFPPDFPVLHPALLAAALAGFSVCIARFRDPFYSVLIYWWSFGMLPLLLSNPPMVPEDRRSMMTLPPLILLAAVGVVAAAGVLARFLSGARGGRVLLAAGALAAAVWYGHANWSDYFDRNQRDPTLLDWERASHVSVLKAIHAAAEDAPAVLVSTWRMNSEVWDTPGEDPFCAMELSAAIPYIPVFWYQRYPGFFSDHGLPAALNWALTQRPATGSPGAGAHFDILFYLTPFYFHLEPLLRQMGGVMVKEIPLLDSYNGPLRDTGMAQDDHCLGRLYRLRDLTQAQMDAALQGRMFTLHQEALTAPRPLTQQQVLDLDHASPQYHAFVDAYLKRPGAWTAARTQDLQVVDPWYWETDGNWPQGFRSPMRATLRCGLDIPKDGDYAFGASASVLTSIRIDGKVVFRRDGADPAAREEAAKSIPDSKVKVGNEAERRGVLGAALHLAAGTHRFEIEQVIFNERPGFNVLLRPIWKAPGGTAETLPLERLIPSPPAGR